MKNVEELDLYKEYKFTYDKAIELEFFDKVQEAQYYYEYAQQLKKKIDNGETILYKVNFWERKIMTKKISKRQENLLKMIDKTKDDKDYQKIWERKLEELKKKEVADFFGGIVNDKR